jgi:signal transduction histidine kinase
MLVLTVVLGAAAFAFGASFIMQIAQNKRLSRKLRTLNDEERAQLVTMSFPSKANEELVNEINRLIIAKEERSRAFRVNETKLRQAISNISHDMRTPLTAVLGYLRLINQGGLPAPERERYARIAETRARALNRLIQDFYDLSRIDEGEYRFECEWIDANQRCLELIAAAYDNFTNIGISVSVDLPAMAPKVFADRGAVTRVFENVLGNVIKHGKDSLDVMGRLENRAFILSFENGCAAMSERGLERVFERSYTLSDSRSNENTGLGLSICKALLNKMGHDVEASYRDGRFTIDVTFDLEGTGLERNGGANEKE